MESFVEWGYLGLFIASFLAATVIPLSSEIVLSILIANNYDLTLSLFVASLGSLSITQRSNWINIKLFS